MSVTTVHPRSTGAQEEQVSCRHCEGPQRAPYCSIHNEASCAQFWQSNLSGQVCKSIVYELQKMQCLALGECVIIPALLYLAELVNAALSTIHILDKKSNEQSVQLEPQRKRRKEAVKEVSELYSTLNHHAGHPGVDKMMDALGKTFYIL